MVRQLPPLAPKGNLRPQDRKAHRRLFRLREQFAGVSRRLERRQWARLWVRATLVASAIGLFAGIAVAFVLHFTGQSLPL